MVGFDVLQNSIEKAASRFPVKRVDLFGSYAEGRAREDSDIDLLVEFDTDAVSLLMLSALKDDLKDELGVPVDVIHAPLPVDSFLDIGETVSVYER